MCCELLVDRQKVGSYEIGGVEVSFQQCAKKVPRFSQHAVLQVGTEFRIQLLVRIVGGDLSQLQPLSGEVVHKTLSSSVIQQTFDLPMQNLRFKQSATGRQLDQVFVGEGIPEEIGQPAGDAEASTPAAGST